MIVSKTILIFSLFGLAVTTPIDVESQSSVAEPVQEVMRHEVQGEVADVLRAVVQVKNSTNTTVATTAGLGILGALNSAAVGGRYPGGFGMGYGVYGYGKTPYYPFYPRFFLRK